MPHHVFFPLHREWEACLTAFLAHVYSLSNSQHTPRLYRAHLAAFFTDCRKTPDAYTRAEVESFLASPTRAVWRHGTPPSASTRHARLVALNSFYRFAASWIVTQDGKRVRLLDCPPPTVGIAYGRRANQHSALSSADLKRLLAVIPTDTVQGLRDRAILLLFFWTARRKSELARLTWGDIEYGVVVDAQGHARAGWLYHFRGKGRGIEDDSAELPLPAKQAIDRYLTVSGRMRTIQPSDPLFTPVRSTRSLSLPLTGNGMTYILKMRLARAGLDPRRYSIHSLRHTSLREHYAAHPDPRAIQRLARHSSLQTTDTYLGELFGTADPVVDALTARFGNL